jgi:murein DD-endopeptidase MepM/ murein hydrolase activator NlpD
MSAARHPRPLRPLGLALLVLLLLTSLPTLPDAESAAAPVAANRARVRAPKGEKTLRTRSAAKRPRVKRVRATDGRLAAALTGPHVALPAGIFAHAKDVQRPLSTRERETLEESLQEEIPPPAKGAAPPAAAEPPLTWPIAGPVNSPFGPRHGRFHAGIDIGAPKYDPVVAAADGLVLYAAASHGPMGNTVVLQHDGDLLTVYAHLSRILTKEGMAVHQGDLIARVGSTGRSTGPHLHFAVRAGGTPVNPEDFLPPPDDFSTPVLAQHASVR